MEEHVYTIMETIQEHITVERERLKQEILDWIGGFWPICD